MILIDVVTAFTGKMCRKKTVMVFCYQNCSSDWEKLLKFEAEGRELAKFLRSLEQFLGTVKD